MRFQFRGLGLTLDGVFIVAFGEVDVGQGVVVSARFGFQFQRLKRTFQCIVQVARRVADQPGVLVESRGAFGVFGNRVAELLHGLLDQAGYLGAVLRRLSG